MLKLIDIKKTYKVGEIKTKALDDINVTFRECEFVAILGTSGSGKTTCLNIIGGLDRYDSGEIIIKGRKTSDFEDRDWDAYRNNSIGFVFQSYNLISHLSIVANVELSLTLSGVDVLEKRRRALWILEQVGLREHLHKKPNQLSGGQMQRVAIARALVNDPEILLCDEPTGALDTSTSIEILNLIKEIAKERLVIMVTHNPKLAKQYADRIIEFKDGKIKFDSNPYSEVSKKDLFKIKKTSMSFFTALNISFNNIRTKKGRTFLTSLASSIGIISIAVILSISNGFQNKIDEFQSDVMAEFPIIISPNSMQLNEDNIKNMNKQSVFCSNKSPNYNNSDEVFFYDPSKENFVHKNMITDEYINYINKIDPKICNSIGYTRLVNMNLIHKVDGNIIPVHINSNADKVAFNGVTNMTSMRDSKISSYPVQVSKEEINYLEKNYDLLSGNYPKSEDELVLVVDAKNRVSVDTLNRLGFKTDYVESIKYSDIIGTEFKLVHNDDYYKKTQMGIYLPNDDYESMYNSNNSITLKISGIVRKNPNTNISTLPPGIAYSDKLAQKIINRAIDSEIVKAQREADYNIFTTKDIQPEEKELALSFLGGKVTPLMVLLYPNNFEDKELVTQYLDGYNFNRVQEDKIIYTDLASTISNMTSNIMDGITLVLIAFAAVSLIVSIIMIGIITYTSVLERTKEIGILKALGARNKDITRVFDAETCILGVFSGVLGVSIAFFCTVPINQYIYEATALENVAQLKFIHGISLIIISTVLTMVGGHIPAKMASKKDAVEALRSE